MSSISCAVLRRVGVAALVLAAALGTAVAQRRSAADSSPLTETERIRHVLSRFAFGAAPGLVEQVREVGLEAWLDRQFAAAANEPQSLLEQLEAMPALELDAREALRRYRSPPRAERPRPGVAAQVRDAVLLRAVSSANQVRETAVDFFRNHFNVDVNKSPVDHLVADWEREVLRAGTLGSFRTMLERSAKHPAMLVYLDQAVSRRPPSKAEVREREINVRTRTRSRRRGEEAAQISAQLGLNENYARELLELHTLGVDRGYTQRDVVEVAKALTGWTVSLDPKREVGFRFDAGRHYRGEKWVLGRAVRASSAEPVREGEEILERLAVHKGTADFLAFKLCRHFVHDEPDDAMIGRIAAVFRRTRGDLGATLRAVVDDREFFAPRSFQAKFKRPLEFVVSALRVTGAEVTSTRALHGVLDALGEPIYRCEDPTGYYDQAEAWRDPGVMAVRWKFAMDLARGRVQGVKIPASFYAGLHPKIRRAWRDQLAERILPAGMSPQTARVLDQRVKVFLRKIPDPAPRELGPLIVGLLIGSPEFQRQ